MPGKVGNDPTAKGHVGGSNTHWQTMVRALCSWVEDVNTAEKYVKAFYAAMTKLCAGARVGVGASVASSVVAAKHVTVVKELSFTPPVAEEGGSRALVSKDTTCSTSSFATNELCQLAARFLRTTKAAATKRKVPSVPMTEDLTKCTMSGTKEATTSCCRSSSRRSPALPPPSPPLPPTPPAPALLLPAKRCGSHDAARCNSTRKPYPCTPPPQKEPLPAGWLHALSLQVESVVPAHKSDVAACTAAHGVLQPNGCRDRNAFMNLDVAMLKFVLKSAGCSEQHLTSAAALLVAAKACPTITPPPTSKLALGASMAPSTTASITPDAAGLGIGAGSDAGGLHPAAAEPPELPAPVPKAAELPPAAKPATTTSTTPDAGGLRPAAEPQTKDLHAGPPVQLVDTRGRGSPAAPTAVEDGEAELIRGASNADDTVAAVMEAQDAEEAANEGNSADGGSCPDEEPAELGEAGAAKPGAAAAGTAAPAAELAAAAAEPEAPKCEAQEPGAPDREPTRKRAALWWSRRRGGRAARRRAARR